MIRQAFKTYGLRFNYGNLKDSDRIFTNVYRDADPYIEGALKRVPPTLLRATGIEPKISSVTESTGSLTKLRPQASEVEVVLVSPLASNTPSCPKSLPRSGPAILLSTPMSQNQEAPRRMMVGQTATVSTLVTVVGQLKTPLLAGNGGFNLGFPGFPSRLSISPVSSPQM